MFIILPGRALQVESPSREAIYATGVRAGGAWSTGNVSMSPRSSMWAQGFGFCPLGCSSYAYVPRLPVFGTGLFILYHCMLKMCNLLGFYRSLQYGDCLHFSEETLALEFWIMLKLEDCGDLWSWTNYVLLYELAMSLWGPRAEYCIWMWNSPQGQVFNTHFPSL